VPSTAILSVAALALYSAPLSEVELALSLVPPLVRLMAPDLALDSAISSVAAWAPALGQQMAPVSAR
jgi:hypothetical protein